MRFENGHIAWSKGLTKETDERLDFERPTKFKKGHKPWNKDLKGVSIPGNKKNIDERIVIDLYLNKNISAPKIAKKFNCSVGPIYRILNENKIEVKYSYNYTKEIPWNKEIADKAYILGVIVGDGCITISEKSRTYSVQLNVKDRDFLKKFKSEIYKCYGVKCKEYLVKNTNPNWRQQYVAMVHSKEICLDLVKILDKHNTGDWRVPKEILQSDNKLIIGNFLKGFYDSEGTVRIQSPGNNVDVATVCKGGMEEINYLMSKLGFNLRLQEKTPKNPKYKKVYSLRITNKEDILKFKKFIGFTIKRKSRILDEAKNIKSIRKGTGKEYHDTIRLKKQGLTVQQISDRLNIPKTSLMGWIYYNKKPFEVHNAISI